MRTLLLTSLICALIPVWMTAQQVASPPSRPPADPRSRGGGECRDNVYNCVDTPNPLPRSSTLWLEDMTWMDLRDAMASGVDTILVPTGGIEPSGPWLTLGKHNHVMRANCPEVARRLGNALCAPIVKFVPEGALDPPSGHMLTAGTISVSQGTFEALLGDLASSFKAHGFATIIFLGDSGGNQRGQQAVAERLNARWAGKPQVLHIGEYYDNAAVEQYLFDLGVTRGGLKRTDASWPGTDKIHDEPFYELNIFADDPAGLRWAERVQAGLATIDGMSVADRARIAELADKVVAFRADIAVAAIRTALASHRSRP